MDKLYIQVDVEGYITAVAQDAFEGHMETDMTIDEFMDRYGEECVTDGRHRYINGEIICDEGTARSLAVYNEELQNNLRARRETECFAIVNRGIVWYDTLEEWQRNELSNWYTAWLNVTETLNVPVKPEWLK
jgi:hypothetical protein